MRRTPPRLAKVNALLAILSAQETCDENSSDEGSVADDDFATVDPHPEVLSLRDAVDPSTLPLRLAAALVDKRDLSAKLEESNTALAHAEKMNRLYRLAWGFAS